MTITSRNHLKLSLLSMLAIGPGLLLNSALGPIQHLIQKEFGIENTMTFSPTIIGMVTLALFIPCGPILKHRIGIRTSYLISMVVFVFGSLLAALSMDMYWMTISRFLQGMATGVMLMIMIPTLVLSFPIDKRNLALAVLLLGFFGSTVLGMFLGNVAMIYSHWRWIFYVAGTLACIGAILCRVFLKIETSHLKNEQPSQPSILILNFCLLIVDSIKEANGPLLELKWIKHPKPLLGMSMAVISNIILMLSLFAIQGMLNEIHHVLPEQTLFIYVCMFVGVVISSILCTILYDILGPGLLGFLGSITILTVIVQWMFITQGMPSSFILILMNITLLTSGVGITIGSGLMGAALGGPLPDLVKRMTVVQFFRFMLNTLSTIVIGWYTTQFSVTGLSKNPSMESSLTYHNILIAALIVNIILSCLSFGLHLTGKGHKLAHKPHLSHETANKNAARS